MGNKWVPVAGADQFMATPPADQRRFHPPPDTPAKWREVLREAGMYIHSCVQAAATKEFNGFREVFGPQPAEDQVPAPESPRVRGPPSMRSQPAASRKTSEGTQARPLCVLYQLMLMCG